MDQFNKSKTSNNLIIIDKQLSSLWPNSFGGFDYQYLTRDFVKYTLIKQMDQNSQNMNTHWFISLEGVFDQISWLGTQANEKSSSSRFKIGLEETSGRPRIWNVCIFIYLFSVYYSYWYRTLRYEDLSLNPYDVTQDILQFYGLPFDPAVEEFLDTHTKENKGGVSSTYRDSRSAPFHWKQDLRADEVSATIILFEWNRFECFFFILIPTTDRSNKFRMCA